MHHWHAERRRQTPQCRHSWYAGRAECRRTACRPTTRVRYADSACTATRPSRRHSWCAPKRCPPPTKILRTERPLHPWRRAPRTVLPYLTCDACAHEWRKHARVQAGAGHVPCPHCPCSPEPQVRRTPLRVTAAECEVPATMATMICCGGHATSAGEVVSASSPVPSWPQSLVPHANIRSLRTFGACAEDNRTT